MRIAMIVPSLDATGPEFVARDLCQEFVKKGHTCKVFYFDDKVRLEMPCDIERIDFFSPINFDDWDVIHSHMFRPDAYVWFHRHKIKSAKIISTIHNPISYKDVRMTYDIPRSVILSSFWRMFLKAHNHIVTLNSITQSELPSYLNRKSTVIFNGRAVLRTNNVQHNQGIALLNKLKERFKIVGYVGSLTPRKGCSQMIEALPMLKDFALVLVGDGPDKTKLQELSKQLGVDDRCLFAGFNENPSPYFELMDVFCMCSFSEGFPLALIESAAHGCPAVLSDIPIFKSIVSQDSGVQFYQQKNIEDLSDKIIEIYNNREEKSKQIREFYNMNLTPEIMADKYMTLYTSR